MEQNNPNLLVKIETSEGDPNAVDTKIYLSNQHKPVEQEPATAKDDKFIEKLMIFLSIIIVIITLPASLCCLFFVVRQYQRAVILRNGKVRENRAFGPGLICYLPCVDNVKFIDLRIYCYPVPPQEALTKDALTVSVDAVVYYKVQQPVKAVVNVTDYMTATQLLASTTLRNAIGSRKLSELLTDRPAVGNQVLQQMIDSTKRWGIHVLRVDIKDIRLPLQLQKAMAAEAESFRLANAKVIVANAEIQSIKSLQTASALLAENPFCMQLRYLQALQMISSENTHTIVFPLPVELLKTLFK